MLVKQNRRRRVTTAAAGRAGGVMTSFGIANPTLVRLLGEPDESLHSFAARSEQA
jgi:hypothetical protein